jgi:hypothetical protein
MADAPSCWLCASEDATPITIATFDFLQELQEGVETGENHEDIRLGSKCRQHVSGAKTAIAGNVRTGLRVKAAVFVRARKHVC